jgi:hypothetical protein
VLWLDSAGQWSEDPQIVAERLEHAATQHEVIPADPAELQRYLSLLACPIRDRLHFARSRRWIIPDPTPATRRLVTRLHSLMGQAARRRNPKALEELERANDFVTGGHTAGEASLIERLEAASQPELQRLIKALPSRERLKDELEVKLTGLVLFGSLKTTGGAVACPPCPGSRPPYSISMEP